MSAQMKAVRGTKIMTHNSKTRRKLDVVLDAMIAEKMSLFCSSRLRRELMTRAHTTKL